MEKLKRLIIIAPNDRYNYGDLLFSHIIKKELGSLYDEIINVATIENDLTQVGGDKVLALSTIYSLSDDFENHIIIAGGESFFSIWYYCLKYIDGNFASIMEPLSKVLRKVKLENIINSISLLISKLKLGATTKYPYTIGKNELKNIDRIFYNSLGGSSLKIENIKENLHILKNVDYISLRDEHSYQMIKNSGIKDYLYPDCAIQMSKYYDLRNELQTKTSDLINSKINEEESNYFVFQINSTLGEKYFEEIVDLINYIYLNHKAKVFLCPVGFALGHEDHIILKKIHNHINNDSITIFYSNITIWDIMSIIGNSKMYIGTSLHGAITSMSFSVPYIGIMVNKTINYIKNWGIDSDFVTSHSFKHIKVSIDELQRDQTLKLVLKNNAKEQISASEQSFYNIRNIISSKN